MVATVLHRGMAQSGGTTFALGRPHLAPMVTYSRNHSRGVEQPQCNVNMESDTALFSHTCMRNQQVQQRNTLRASEAPSLVVPPRTVTSYFPVS